MFNFHALREAILKLSKNCNILYNILMWNLRDIKTLTIFGVTAIVVILLFFARVNGYPVPPPNSALFVPLAINYAAGNGLTDELSHVVANINNARTDESRITTSYPPLYPILMSTLMPTANTQGAFVAIAIIEDLIVIFTAWFLWKAVKMGRDGEGDWLDVLIVIFGLFAVIAPLLTFNSTRTELVFQLFSLAWLMLALRFSNSKYLWPLFGLILGLGGAIHPMHAIYFSLLIGIFFSFGRGVKPAIREILKTYLLGLGVFLFIMAITPNGIVEKISGTLAHARLYGKGISFLPGSSTDLDSSAGTYWVTLFLYLVKSPSSFFWGPFSVFLAMLGLRFYKNLASRIKSRSLFFLFLLPFLAIMTGIALTHSDSTYYLTMFGSLFFVLAAYVVSKEKKAAFKLSLLVFFVVMSVSSIRIFALIPFYLSEGVTLGEAREIYKELNPPNCENCIGISPSNLWTLSENYKSMMTYFEAKNAGKKLGEEVGVILLGQQWSGLTKPPEEFSGCGLEKDYFAKGTPPKILGAKIANIVPGYGFASYRCR